MHGEADSLALVWIPFWIPKRKSQTIYSLPISHLVMLAEWTGLEPATSAVTGQHSNQLNYHSISNDIGQLAGGC